MDQKDWILLETLYKTRNISKAAELMYVTQPALTNRIQRLEGEFNIKIVSRFKKGIEFTVEGEYLVQYSKHMLKEYHKTKDHLLNIGNDARGFLKLGVNSHYANYKLTNILRDFSNLHPKIQIKVKTGPSSMIMKHLYNEDVHIAIEAGGFHWSGNEEVIAEEEICIISNKVITLEEIPHLPMIKFKTNRLLEKEIDTWWRKQYNKPPSAAMEIDSAETCKKMVSNGFGFAIVPKFCLTNDHELFCIDLFTSEGKKFLRNIWMKYNPALLDHYAVNKFVSFMKFQGKLS